MKTDRTIIIYGVCNQEYCPIGGCKTCLEYVKQIVPFKITKIHTHEGKVIQR